jgi:hypothetical protein
LLITGSSERAHDLLEAPNRPERLISDLTAVTPSVLSPATERVQRIQTQVFSANTRRGFETDWRAFSFWCARGGHQALPAAPATVADYLASSAERRSPDGSWKYAPGTLGRWLASINKAHAVAGFVKPGPHPDVELTMRGIRRARGHQDRRKAPLLLDDLRRVFDVIDFTSYPAGVIGHRDWTALLVGWAGAFRRSELVALELRDFTRHSKDGLHVLVRQSKTDQEGRGVTKGGPLRANSANLPGVCLRPVAACARGYPGPAPDAHETAPRKRPERTRLPGANSPPGSCAHDAIFIRSLRPPQFTSEPCPAAP